VDATVTQNANVLTANASGAVYGWMDCGTSTMISGENGQSFTATADGDYAAVVTENNCTDTSACVTVTGTGIVAKSNADLIMSVYPNPSTGTFILKSNVEGTYSIVNNIGQVIRTVTLAAANNAVEINNLDNGVYFISSDKGLLKQRIVVVK
jgi:hypothetical protein